MERAGEFGNAAEFFKGELVSAMRADIIEGLYLASAGMDNND